MHLDIDTAASEDQLDHSHSSPSTTTTLCNDSSRATSQSVSQIPDSTPNTEYSPGNGSHCSVTSSPDVLPLLVDDTSTREPSTLHRGVSPPIDNGQNAAAGSGFPCQKGCDHVASSRKDLERHHKSQRHSPELYRQSTVALQGTFQCACGHRAARRDNYLRHVRKCKQCHRTSFLCANGHAHQTKEEHLRHLADTNECGKRLGRPPSVGLHASAVVDARI